MNLRETVGRFIPLVPTLLDYELEHSRHDLLAGLTTGVLLIPQAMAYAMLAGLPPIVGLYAATIPLFVYALFGSSRQLGVGPVAMVSLLVASGVGQLAEPGSSTYVGLAVVLMLMVGAIQLTLGLVRAGFLVNFLSHPVVAGFTSAAALIIIFSQLEHLLGVDLARSDKVHEVAIEAVNRIGEVQLETIIIALVAIAILAALKIWAPRFPRALLVVALSTVAVWAFGLHARGVDIVGDIPAGFPSPALPGVDLEALRTLWPTALTIALVGFMEAISVAKVFARKNRYEIDANRELVGLGLANLAGSLFRGYPVAGAFSRTAVNGQAGARTVVASLVTGVVVVATLLFLTPLFYYLPNAILAAIITVAIVGLIDVEEARRLWRVDRRDLALFVLTFAATLGLGVQPGILVGVGASLIAWAIRTAQPRSVVLGRIPGTDIFRDVERFEDAEEVDDLLILRVDESLFFANVAFLRQAVTEHQREAEQHEGQALDAVIIDATSVNYIDSSADAALHEIHEQLDEDDIELHVAGLKQPVHELLDRSGFTEAIGEARIHLSVHEAVESLTDEPRRTSDANEPDEAPSAA